MEKESLNDSLKCERQPFIKALNKNDMDEFLQPETRDEEISMILYDRNEKNIIVFLKERNTIYSRRFSDFDADVGVFENPEGMSWTEFMIKKFGDNYEQALNEHNLKSKKSASTTITM